MTAIRYSKQRETIYDILKNNPTHPSVDDLYVKVREVIPDISLGTVYRNLNFLVEHGRIITFNVNDKAHYDARIEPHFHFVCKECGEIKDIEISEHILNHIIDDVEKDGDKLEEIKVTINGTCSQCLKKEI